MDYLDFPKMIQNFSQIEYLTIILSFIYALSLTDMFNHINLMVKSKKYYSETLIWSFLVIFFIIIHWYTSWIDLDFLSISLFYFILKFIPAFLLFALIIMLYPSVNIKEKNYNPEKVFLDNRIFIFVLIFLMTISSVLSNIFESHFFSPLNYVRLLNALIIFFCILIDSKILRYFAAWWTTVWYGILIFYIYS